MLFMAHTVIFPVSVSVHFRAHAACSLLMLVLLLQPWTSSTGTAIGICRGLEHYAPIDPTCQRLWNFFMTMYRPLATLQWLVHDAVQHVPSEQVWLRACLISCWSHPTTGWGMRPGRPSAYVLHLHVCAAACKLCVGVHCAVLPRVHSKGGMAGLLRRRDGRDTPAGCQPPQAGQCVGSCNGGAAGVHHGALLGWDDWHLNRIFFDFPLHPTRPRLRLLLTAVCRVKSIFPQLFLVEHTHVKLTSKWCTTPPSPALELPASLDVHQLWPTVRYDTMLSGISKYAWQRRLATSLGQLRIITGHEACDMSQPSRVITTSSHEPAAAPATAAKPQLLKEFLVYRWDPDTGAKPRYDSYKVDINACGPMLLDVLFKIKDEDDTSLSFRRSCRLVHISTYSLSIYSQRLTTLCTGRGFAAAVQ